MILKPMAGLLDNLYLKHDSLYPQPPLVIDWAWHVKLVSFNISSCIRLYINIVIIQQGSTYLLEISAIKFNTMHRRVLFTITLQIIYLRPKFTWCLASWNRTLLKWSWLAKLCTFCISSSNCWWWLIFHNWQSIWYQRCLNIFAYRWVSARKM